MQNGKGEIKEKLSMVLVRQRASLRRAKMERGLGAHEGWKQVLSRELKGRQVKEKGSK